MPAVAVLLLLLIVTAAIIALTIRQRQKSEISTALLILQDSRQPVMQVESTLEALFLAENEFKEYTLSYDRRHFENYRNQLARLTSHLDTLQTMIAPFKKGEESDAWKIIDERDREATSYIRLKRLTDSLMIITASLDSVPLEKAGEELTIRKFTPGTGDLSIDTLDISKTTGTRKKGLLGQLKSFLVGEEGQETVNTKVVVKQGGQTDKSTAGASPASDSLFSLNSFAEDIINKSNSYYQSQLRLQLHRRNELRLKELNLIRLNNSLMDEIREILFTLKEIAVENENHFRDQSAQKVTRSTGILLTVLISSVIGALLLTLALAWMLIENNRYQIKLRESREKALKEAEEKRRFLAYMSHEFRTPLSSVIGFTEQLEKSGLNEEQTEYLAGILSSSEILLTTVNDILDLSKLESGKMTFLSNPFRPEETIRQCIRSFENITKEKNLKVKTNLFGPGHVVIGDEVRLRQVLNNLISNAVKYTLKGSITVDADITEENGKSSLRVSVADTGIGISASQLADIFNEYSRVHSSDGFSRWIIGTGLGLPVTKRLVEEMGGTIEVKSEKGEGSVFSFRIPYLTGSPDTLPVKSRSDVKELSIPDVKILIADDDYFNVLLLKTIFKHTGAKTDLVDNGEDAFRKITSGNYDIILSDMYMPRLDGLELTRKIRGLSDVEKAKTPVVMITGNVTPEAAENMEAAGVSSYLFKPFQQKDLFEIISSYLS